MAYSDYGGRAYLGWDQVPDRCDAVVTSSGVRSTPGRWPGLSIPEGRAGRSFHVLLGDGPICVGLLKQSYVEILRDGETAPLTDYVVDPLPGAVEDCGGAPRFDHSPYLDDECVALFRIDGHEVRVFWSEEEDFYVYAQLTQPDGRVWRGWSGYGVGTGFDDEECDAARDARLRELFA